MEIEDNNNNNSNYDNLKSRTANQLIKTYSDLPNINFEEKDKTKKKVLERTEVKIVFLNIYLLESINYLFEFMQAGEKFN